jgi:hypothetical protein
MSKQDLALKDRNPIEMGEEELEKVKEIPKLLDRAYRELLQKGTDYGTLPGTPKPSLWKPGAELLVRWMRASGDTRIVESITPKEGGPLYFSYTAECRIFNRAGEFLGNGFGSCNSKETRYAFRWVFENQIPDGIDKPKLKTRTFKNQNGKEITQYRIDTPSDEIYTLQNTIVKMAKKRAFIDAVLSVTGASRIFTQDIEDEGDQEEKKGVDIEAASKAATPDDSNRDAKSKDEGRAISNAKPVGKSQAVETPKLPPKFDESSLNSFMWEEIPGGESASILDPVDKSVFGEAQLLIDYIKANNGKVVINGWAYFYRPVSKTVFRRKDGAV